MNKITLCHSSSSIMAIGNGHVLLCGPPGCGKTTYANKHMPKEGGVLIQGGSIAVVEENAIVYLESIESRDAWTLKKSYGAYFSKVVYWTSVDATKEPEIITKTAENKQRWLWFWGFATPKRPIH